MYDMSGFRSTAFVNKRAFKKEKKKKKELCTFQIHVHQFFCLF